MIVELALASIVCFCYGGFHYWTDFLFIFFCVWGNVNWGSFLSFVGFWRSEFYIYHGFHLTDFTSFIFLLLF